MEENIFENNLEEEAGEEVAEDKNLEESGEPDEDEEDTNEEDEKEEVEETKEDEEESIGKVRLGVSSSNFSNQSAQKLKRGGLEKEVFTGDEVWGGGEAELDLIEEKYRAEDRDREEESNPVKHGVRDDNFYDDSSNKNYNEKNLSRSDDDFEVEIGSRDLKDRRSEEFYSLRKNKEDDKRDSLVPFEGGGRTYFEMNKKSKDYLA